MRKFGLKLWSVNTDTYLREAVKLYARGAFDYIEVYFVPGSDATARDWKATGIPSIVHGPHLGHGVSLATPELRESNLRAFRAAARFADALSAPTIIAHGGAFGSPTEVVRQMKEIGDPRLVIENNPFLHADRSGRKLAVSTPQEVREVLEGGPGVRFCLDFGHAVSSANAHGLDWREFLESFLSLGPALYHLSDIGIGSDVDQHLHFGEGSFPIADVLPRLPDNAMISIETRHDFRENLDDFVRDAETLRKIP